MLIRYSFVGVTTLWKTTQKQSPRHIYNRSHHGSRRVVRSNWKLVHTNKKIFPSDVGVCWDVGLFQINKQKKPTPMWKYIKTKSIGLNQWLKSLHHHRQCHLRTTWKLSRDITIARKYLRRNLLRIAWSQEVYTNYCEISILCVKSPTSKKSPKYLWKATPGLIQ